MIRMAFGLGALCLLLALGVVLYRFGAELAREAAQEIQVGKNSDETVPPPAPEKPETKAAETAPAPESAAPSAEHAAAPSAPTAPPSPEVPGAGPAPNETPAAAAEVPAQPVRTHRVASGDSLWKLSVQYYGSATHVAELMQANQLTAATLRPGQVLVIPEIAGTKAADAAGNAAAEPVNADHEIAQGTAPNESANETEQAATPAPSAAPAASGSGDSPFVPMPPSL